MQDYSTYSDEQLVALLKLSDEEAFNQLYHRYWQKLFYTAGIKLDDPCLAKEIVQDIFADIWERRTSIELTALFKTYISAALKYKIITRQVHRKRTNNPIDPSENHIEIADYTTEQFLDFEELKDRLAKFVGNLPEKCQLIFRLSREGGLSQKEIAHRLSISERTVESHLYKALNKLRHSLGQFLFSFFFL